MLSTTLSDDELRELLSTPHALELLAFMAVEARGYGELDDLIGLGKHAYRAPFKALQELGLVRPSDLAAFITMNGRALLHELKDLCGIDILKENAAVDALRRKIMERLKV